MSFIAGQYTATYKTSALGQTAEGWRCSHQFFKRLITGDTYAQTPQDAVYQGAEVFVQGRLIEYNATGALGAFWPYSSTIFALGVIGRLDVASSIAGALVLTALAGTPAAAAPATLTFTQAILAEGFPVELLFAPDLREVPLRFRCYPYFATPNQVFGVTT